VRWPRVAITAESAHFRELDSRPFHRDEIDDGLLHAAVYNVGEGAQNDQTADDEAPMFKHFFVTPGMRAIAPVLSPRGEADA
jgi:hypothetical protein